MTGTHDDDATIDATLRDALDLHRSSHPQRSRYNLRTLARLVPPLVLLDMAARTADLDAALNGLELILERVGPARLGAALAAKPELLPRLLVLGSASEHLPELAAEFLDALVAWSAREATVEGLIDRCPAADAAGLSRWHRWQRLRICTLELEQRLDTEQVATVLSRLADATVRTALGIASDTASDRIGTLPVAVFAQGKWGSEELNYSSDIDLFFVRPDRSDEARAEALARQLLQLLAGRGGADHLYRTDLRLRPGGPGTPLVPSLSQARGAFATTAGTWERMVHLRTRHAAGNQDVARELLPELDRFSYEQPFHIQEIREIKNYKDLLERQAQGRDLQDRELKVGIGGIRDVEYVVQFLQLFHGAVFSGVRGGNVFAAIRSLGQVGALTTAETAYLLDGYRFLRRIEHRLMLRHRRQSFLLPERHDEQRALAGGLGFPDWPAFLEEFDRRRRSVRALLDRLFHRLFTAEGDAEIREMNLILAFRPDPAEIERVFAPLHFRDPHKAYRLLRRLAYPRRPLLQTPRVRQFLAHLFPQLLASLRETPDPDQAVLLFTNCVETLGTPATFYQLLAERPENCKLFVDLFGSSRFLSDLLLDQPGILDELIDRLRTGRKITEEEVLAELQGIPEDADRVMRARIYHETRTLHLLEIAVLDLANRIPVLGVLQRLSAVARALVRTIDEQVLKELHQRLGPLVAPPGAPPPRHVILALGRLGGQEMGYGSDIDMILVYDGVGTTRDGIGEREFFVQHFQHVSATLSNPGAGGPLYPVDLRLRPRGQGGALVHSLREFQHYFLSEESQVWEHQALVRCSAAAGDLELGEQLLGWIRQHIGRGLEEEDILREMAAMHARRKEARPATGLHLKTGPGGIFDIEFLVQSGLLLGARRDPGLWEPNTHRAIQRLATAGWFTDQEAATLATAYIFFRLVENRLSMMHRASVRRVSTDDRSMRDLARRIGYRAAGRAGAPERLLQDELLHHTQAVLAILERRLEQ